MSTEKLIGNCGVDSGQIMIVDPCYIINNKFSDEQYDECCQVTLSEDQAGAVMRNLAVVSTTGIGDGYYPVYATFDDIDGWGERITELRIDFTDHVLLNEEEKECQRCGDTLGSSEEEYCWRCEEIADQYQTDKE